MHILNSINDFLWTYIIVAVLAGAAIYFTVRTRGVQFRMIGEMTRLMLGRDRKNEKGGIGSFQAFAVSLASRVGTGNLAGVASAIFVGGPGAVFWMWVMAIFGAATAFIEATLAQLYKKKGPDSYYGGPAYYMMAGLGSRWRGILFSILMIITFGLANQCVQANTIVASLNETFGWSKIIVGTALAVALLSIIIGGIKRISTFLSYLVPFMALAYLALTAVVIVMNFDKIPEVFRTIIESAFGIRQIGGGMIGTAILQGVKRGLFSNEAGEGSAPNAAAIAQTSHPVKQGLIQSLGVYIDTIVICSCTAFIILVSGLYQSGADGIVLTIRALESEIGPAGRYFITAAILLFAFSTIIANYFYGETNIRFVTGKKGWVTAFQILSSLIVIAGSVLSLQTVWSLVDIAMGLLTLCNLSAILQLTGRVVVLLKDYRKQKAEGKEPEFHKDAIPGLGGEIECWE